MAIPFVSVLVLLSAQAQVEGLPKFVFKPAVTAGQREIVLGPQIQYDVTMEVRREKEVDTQFTPNKILGPALFTYSLGYVRWTCSDGKLFEKPCRILKMEGVTKGSNQTKTKTIEYATRNDTTYWITPEGKLLRQSVHLRGPDDNKDAECVFWADHIEVSVIDKRGRRSFTVYPNVDLSLVDLQFKPMLEGEKVILGQKEYLVFEPFSQAFLKYKATAYGQFHGTWLATKFDGTHVDIEGPTGTATVFVSKEGDLVKVDLPHSDSLVLNNLPHSRDPMYLKTVGKGGR